MSDLIYEMKLWPFVKQAWAEVDGRLMQVMRVYEKAEADMEKITGER